MDEPETKNPTGFAEKSASLPLGNDAAASTDTPTEQTTSICLTTGDIESPIVRNMETTKQEERYAVSASDGNDQQPRITSKPADEGSVEQVNDCLTLASKTTYKSDEPSANEEKQTSVAIDAEKTEGTSILSVVLDANLTTDKSDEIAASEENLTSDTVIETDIANVENADRATTPSCILDATEALDKSEETSNSEKYIPPFADDIDTAITNAENVTAPNFAAIETGTAEAIAVFVRNPDDQTENENIPNISAINCFDIDADNTTNVDDQTVDSAAEFNPLDVSDEQQHVDDVDADDADDLDLLPMSPPRGVLSAGPLPDDDDDDGPSEDDENDVGDIVAEAVTPFDDANEINDNDVDDDHFNDDENDDINADYTEYPADNDNASDGIDSEDDNPTADCGADLIIPDRPVPLRTAKKRKRILALASGNEDSSDDDELRAKLDGGDPDADRLCYSSAASTDGDVDGGSGPSPTTLLEECLLDERFEEIVRNEKPGPKSKKASTQLLKELQTRALLQSAIVIPATTDARKRKIRVLESESDDDAERDALAATSVDDIGILSADPIDADDPDDEQLCAHIIIAEPMVVMDVDDDDDDDDEIDTKPMANKNEEYPDSDEPILKKKIKKEKKPSSTKSFKNGDAARMNNGKSRPVASTSSAYIKQEQQHHHHRSKAAASHVSLYTSSDDEYIPNDVYFGTPDRFEVAVARKPRGRGRGGVSSGISRQEEDHRKYNKEKAAASTTSSSGRGRGRGRGRGSSVSKSKSHRQQYESDCYSSDASSSSAAERRRRKIAHKQKRSSAYYPQPQQHQRTNQQQHHHQSQQQQQHHNAAGASKVKRKNQTTRFKDKSRKIPNDVYFDAKVPLHVLYAYGSETSEDELPPFPPLSTITGRPGPSRPHPLPHTKSHGHSSPRGRGGGSNSGRGGSSSGRGGSSSKSSNSHSSTRAYESSMKSPNSSQASKRGRKPTHATSNADLRLKHMRKCFRAAGFRKMRLKELWNDSDSTMDRADKILKLLRENGLIGDPTIDNCRLLRKVVVTNEEVRELDPSLILQTEGRTRRSAALAASAQITEQSADTAADRSGGESNVKTILASPTFVATASAASSNDCNDGTTVAQETLTKIKKLIDSDSDDE